MGKTIGVVLALKDKCSPQLKKIADTMGITEKEAKKLQKQAKDLNKELGAGFKKAGAVCATAIGAISVATATLVTSTSATCDRIDDLSNKIGISRQGFQEWDYILGQNGANIESLQMGMKTLVNQIDGVSKGNKNSVATFRALGISIKDSSGKMKNQEQIFEEVVTALQKMPEGAKKAKIANDLLGRSGSELMPLFNSTTEKLAQQREEYKKLGIAISDEVIDAGNKFGDNSEKLQSVFRGFGAVIGGQFLPIINELTDKFIANMPQIQKSVMPVINGMVGALKFLSEHMELIIAVTTTVVSTFATFQTITTVINILTTLQKVIQFVTVAQGVWNAIMIANPIGAIATAVGLLIGGIVLLVRNWDKVCEAVKKAINAIKEFIGLKPRKKTLEVETKTSNKEEKPKKHALGTSYSTGGPAIVGEFGPELLNLKKGDSVTPAPKTQQVLQGKRDIKIDIHIAGNIIGVDNFVQQVKSSLALELRTVLATV